MTEKETDIEDFKLKDNPFSVPEGYFATLKTSFAEKISSNEVPAETKRRFPAVFRPALAMALSFGFIFAIGYATISILTPAYYKNNIATEFAEDIELVEDGFLSHSFIDFYDFEDDLSSSEEILSEEEIIDYLGWNIDVLILATLE